MKKELFILVISIAVFLFEAQAQVSKGATLLGGNIGGNGNKYKSTTTVTSNDRNWSASLVYGKAIKENLVLGVSALWAYGKNEQPTSMNIYEQKSWGGGLFLRKYKRIGNSSFSVFAQGNVGYKYMTMDTKGGTVMERNEKVHIVGLGAYPGVSFGVSKKLQLEAGLNNFLSLNYETSTNHYRSPVEEGDTQTKAFAFSTSIDNLSNFYIGFRILLN